MGLGEGIGLRDAKPRRLCGGRTGLFSLAEDARRGEPTAEWFDSWEVAEADG